MKVVYLEELVRSSTLRPGLIGLSSNQNSLVGRMISASENFWSEVPLTETYSHAWMVHDGAGVTWEQRWRLNYYHMKDFVGQRIRIFEHPLLTAAEYERLHAVDFENKGHIYPIGRLLLFWTPPGIRRRLHIGLRVCSERVGYYLHGVGAINYCRGLSPHGLHHISLDVGCRIIAEGILKLKEPLCEV